MKFLQYIILLSILIGCTVTKRVHLPGYHFEWKKNEKFLSKQNTFEVKSEGMEHENHSDYTKIKQAPTLSNENFTSSFIEETNDKAKEKVRSTDIKQIYLQHYKKFKKNALKNSEIKTKSPFFIYIKDPEFMKKVGIVIMVIGAFLLLSVFIANLNLLSFTNITIGNGGCLMFIALLILAGIGYLMVLAFGVIPSLIVTFSLIFVGLVILLIATFILNRRR